MKVILLISLATLLTQAAPAQLRKGKKPVQSNQANTQTKKPAGFEWEGETTEVKGTKSSNGNGVATVPASATIVSSNKKNKKTKDAYIKDTRKNGPTNNGTIKGMPAPEKKPASPTTSPSSTTIKFGPNTK